jgi:hypothetical protein
MDTSISELTHNLLVQLARERAELGLPMAHDYEPGTTQACVFERAYVAYLREHEEHEG